MSICSNDDCAKVMPLSERPYCSDACRDRVESRSNKPLHVRVAEALGERVGLIGGEWKGISVDVPGMHRVVWQLPLYDTDWSETGPLIEKYSITIWPVLKPNPRDGISGWSADMGSYEDGYDGLSVGGPTPLVAVCNLILALKEAGKL